MAKTQVDKLEGVDILPDVNFDTVSNSVWVHYYRDGQLHTTNAPDLTLNKKSIQKVKALLQSALDSLNTID